MDAMLQPGQRCDFTCWCHNRIDDYKTYYLVRQKLDEDEYSVVFCCEWCGDPGHGFIPRLWPRVRFSVEDGRPIGEPNHG